MISTILNKIKNSYYSLNCKLRNKNKKFTIISSNCIGTAIYQDVRVRYNTPTIGLFLFAPCYIKLINNLKYYLESPLLFIDNSKYLGKKVDYPIGIIDDIEIHFMHYRNAEDAFEKWTNRAKRVNYNNLYFTFTDRDMCTMKELKEFDEFNSDKKVCFFSKKLSELKSVVWVKEYVNEPTVGDLYSNKYYRRYINIVKWLN